MRYTMVIMLPLLIAPVASGCDTVTELFCRQEERDLMVVTAADRAEMERLVERGWMCDAGAVLTDPTGRPVGRIYHCRKC